MLDGAEDGVSDGTSDNARDGTSDGVSDGTSEGTSDSKGAGRISGTAPAWAEKSPSLIMIVGSEDGISDGTSDKAREGTSDGVSEGRSEGTSDSRGAGKISGTAPACAVKSRSPAGQIAPHMSSKVDTCGQGQSLIPSPHSAQDGILQSANDSNTSKFSSRYVVAVKVKSAPSPHQFLHTISSLRMKLSHSWVGLYTQLSGTATAGAFKARKCRWCPWLPLGKE